MGVYVADCDLGKGLFADRPYIAGEIICVLGGAIITRDDAIAKGESEADPLQIGPDAYIDLVEPFRSLNHECDPNAGIRNDVYLVALRAIKENEEVRIDYSTTMGEDLWTMHCRCASERCRGVVEDFQRLPQEVRIYYLKMRMVQRFLRSHVRNRNRKLVDH